MGNSSVKDQQLKLKILTGQTQSQQLFDFHSPQKQQSLSTLIFPSIIAFKNGDLVYIQGDNIDEDDVQPLYKLEISQHRNNLIIRQLFQRSRNLDGPYMWKVLGDGQQMQLHQQDYVKIGKTKIMFKQLVKQPPTSLKTPSPSHSDPQQTYRNDQSRTQSIQAKASSDACRICFQSLSTSQNPLLSLCKCTGSVKYIHYQCLKDWTSNNVKKQKSANCLFYSYTQPNSCQLCKQLISNQFKYEGQIYNLYQFQKIDPPYAIFENRFFQQQTGKTRVSTYMISIPQNHQITIGRNHNSHVILKDISVSRTHCLIVYKFGSLYIQDKKSKFGTLIRPKNGFCFDSQLGLQLQFQSKIMQISKYKTFKFSNCCLTQNTSYYIQINKQVNSSILQ